MYYKLTYHSTGKHRESVLCSDRPLDIGQTAGCEIRLHEADSHEPMVFATILPREEKGGWLLVRRNDYADIQINGQQLKTASILHDDDKLLFIDEDVETQMDFKICDDSNYDERNGIVFQRPANYRKTTWILIFLVGAALAIAFFALLTSRKNTQLRHMNLDSYASSVFHLTTDSVFLTKDTIIGGEARTIMIDSIALEHPYTGTCFLTDEGYFVTARHCVEPWINDEEWNGRSYKTNIKPEVRLATRAETANRLWNGRYNVYARCVISQGETRIVLKSSDFRMNKSRDLVTCLGESGSPIYWRSIVPMATRRDMELGDFAFYKANSIKGNLTLANEEELATFDKQSDKDIAILGYPSNDNHTDETVKIDHGNSQHLEFISGSSNLKGCIQMTAPVNKGNSGGPVLACIDGKIIVIGIVSKADINASQETFWTVPITEVVTMISQKTMQEEDTLIYLR